MRLTTRQSGIISYAGLDETALWAGAKRAFIQADVLPPRRFRAFLPLFPVELVENMSYLGPGARRANAAGFSMDPAEYHRQLSAEMPSLYAGDNYARNFDTAGQFRGGGPVTVDRAWATQFPQYQPFMGEELMIYMIGEGHQAVAVPESLFPRGGGVLAAAERELRITAGVQHYVAFLTERLTRGQPYDATRFEEEYLRQTGLDAVCVRQKELGRVMQDLSIVRSLKDAVQEEPSQFTENAKRAEGIAQYVPLCTACDTFESVPVTRATARLMQLHFEGDSFVSDFWLPYQDACEYMDRKRMALDVRALCQGFQIPPAYDPQTGGGRYPDQVRVVAVKDRSLRPLVADTLNNPAYGSGMGPMGLLNKLVYLPDSREHLRQDRLLEETVQVLVENAQISPEEYLHMRALALWQEEKGLLVDAMYRRESALSQMQPGTPDYSRALNLLDRRVACLERRVKAADEAHSQLSGYDADIEYLRRMQRNREGVPEEEPFFFSEDALREKCIESGYAMRGGVHSFAMEQLPAAEPKAPERKPKTAKRKTKAKPYEQMDMFSAITYAEPEEPVSPQGKP